MRVTTVAPGAIERPMLRGALEQLGLDTETYAPHLFGRLSRLLPA